MTLNQNSTHQEIVRQWEEKNTKNLNLDQVILIFGVALQSLERRCLITLSNVTMQVVLDRVIHEGLDDFPFLSEITIESQGLNFNFLIQNMDRYKLEDVKNALRYLLIEFLTVIGNITSDVLTAPLHRELMEVTSESALMVLEVQSLKPVSISKKRGGK